MNCRLKMVKIVKFMLYIYLSIKMERNQNKAKQQQNYTWGGREYDGGTSFSRVSFDILNFVKFL